MLGHLKTLPHQKTIDTVLAYGIIVLSLIIFVYFVDKKRLREIYPTGLFISGLAMYHDTIGEYLGLWSYPHNLLLAREDIFIPLTLFFLPMQGMLLIQYLPKDWWHQNWIILGLSLFNSIAEEIVGENTHLYHHHHDNWSTLYSFVTYLILFWTARYLYYWYWEDTGR